MVRNIANYFSKNFLVFNQIFPSSQEVSNAGLGTDFFHFRAGIFDLRLVNELQGSKKWRKVFLA